jgi:hypothetical protein
LFYEMCTVFGFGFISSWGSGYISFSGNSRELNSIKKI